MYETSAMVPCQFTLYFGTSVEATEPGGSAGGINVDREGIGVSGRPLWQGGNDYYWEH